MALLTEDITIPSEWTLVSSDLGGTKYLFLGRVMNNDVHYRFGATSTSAGFRLAKGYNNIMTDEDLYVKSTGDSSIITVTRDHP